MYIGHGGLLLVVGGLLSSHYQIAYHVIILHGAI